MTVDELKAKIMLHSLKLISDDEISDDYIHEICKDINSMNFQMLSLMENMITLRKNSEILKCYNCISQKNESAINKYDSRIKQMNTLLCDVYKAKESLLINNLADNGLFYDIPISNNNSNNNEISDDYFGFDYTADNISGHD